MASAQKCAHKGCGKVFTDPEEPCVYHPGLPEFHEGQKGWKCCKPRVLTFDEFLAIPPCTTGKHSIVDEAAEAQAQQEKEKREKAAAQEKEDNENTLKRVPIAQPKPTSSGPAAGAAPSMALPTPSKSASPAPELEEDSDDPSTPIPAKTTCKRRSCGRSSADSSNPREEECVYHPGMPIFHEGSKGWTCCKRRVLEFDEFMKIEGCKTRKGHCFVGKKSKKTSDKSGANADAGASANQADGRGEEEEEQEEKLQDVRNDFYQTPNTLIVSFYLKKIDKARATVKFRDDGSGVDLDLPTSDGKRFKTALDTWQDLTPDKCESKIMGTKLEMVLHKKDGGVGWPVLRKGERETGERIQVGRAGRA